MRKILVTGNAGSGKSTLSKIFGERLDLPVYSLDGIVWKPGWQKPSPQERAEKMRELLANKKWVIDDVSLDVLKEAELIIFLDFPRRICLWRVIKRNWKYLFHSRPEFPADCPEILIIPKLLKIIWNFPKAIRPQILSEVKKYPDKKFIHIRSTRQLRLVHHWLRESVL